tara:strand:+ start:317 stop:529 length:213 start_codon:yes stop_codon:yes gene_type:complete
MSNHGIRNDDNLKLWFRIKSIEKKIDKLGSMRSRGFDWIEWEGLEEDLVNNVSQLSIYKNIVEGVLSRYD